MVNIQPTVKFAKVGNITLKANVELSIGTGSSRSILTMKKLKLARLFSGVEESKAKVFIYENLKGFLSIDKSETFKQFLQSFKDIVYKNRLKYEKNI